MVDDGLLDAEIDAIAGRLVVTASDAALDHQLDLKRNPKGEAGSLPEMKAAVATFFAGRKR